MTLVESTITNWLANSGRYACFLLFVGLYLSGVFTNYKAYKDYCSGYIPLINEYFEAHGSYPSSLNMLEKPTGGKLIGEYICEFQHRSPGFILHIPSQGGIAVMYIPQRWISGRTNAYRTAAKGWQLLLQSATGHSDKRYQSVRNAISKAL